MLLINSYLPVDSQANNFDETELLETLTYVKNILRDNDYDGIIWSGDLNADFARNSKHTRITKEFIHEHYFEMAWDNYLVDFTHYHEVNNISYTSIIDHFLWSPSLNEDIEDCGVLHHPSNLSDHSPVYCRFKVKEVSRDEIKDRNFHPSRPSWKESTDNEKLAFKMNAEQLLSSIDLPDDLLRCTNVKCTNEKHIIASDKMLLEVLESVDHAARNNLHINNVRKKGKSRCHLVPGWS